MEKEKRGERSTTEERAVLKLEVFGRPEQNRTVSGRGKGLRRVGNTNVKI